ncbi:putative glutathione S-transferase GST-6.0 [Aspergillus bombycis]|uniref:Putative glutathione S-transferase GST-6.0 n=1 Tax=Aspergillus bombycis TaxID=109264 RepID=A0A1F7ZTX8_9EURO|nr:putative glutathione S-transferase GST-6.0 [Aspergillus bombycis]OGM42535.1 putative glutathione S-transferase GST-6.0 [Aspergillus bombycis]
MPNIKFFYSPDACSIIPHILLHETKATFEAIRIEMEGTDLSFPESFRRINPKSRVPVITLDDEVITEVPAVSTMISSLAPEAHLLGRTPIETARVHEWMNYVAGTVHAGGISHVFRPGRWTASTEEKDLEMVKRRGLEILRSCFALIEERLAGEYAVGEDFTAADAFLYFAYRWGVTAEIDMQVYAKFTQLARRVEGRETVQTVLRSERIHSIF